MEVVKKISHKELIENTRLVLINEYFTEPPFDFEDVKKIQIGDLTAVYMYVSEDGIGPVADFAPINAEDLKLIVSEMKKEIVLYSAEDAIKCMQDSSYRPTNWLNESIMDKYELYVLTNRNSHFGASAMIFDDVLDKIRKLIGCDYFIIPMTLDEVLIVPMNEKFLKEKVEICSVMAFICLGESERLELKTYVYSNFVKMIRNLFD